MKYPLWIQNKKRLFGQISIYIHTNIISKVSWTFNAITPCSQSSLISLWNVCWGDLNTSDVQTKKKFINYKLGFASFRKGWINIRSCLYACIVLLSWCFSYTIVTLYTLTASPTRGCRAIGRRKRII